MPAEGVRDESKLPQPDFCRCGAVDRSSLRTGHGAAGYPSNWELSTARASDVVRFLQAKGIDPQRLEAAGYGEYQPVAPNTTPAGRKENRRIEIVLTDMKF